MDIIQYKKTISMNISEKNICTLSLGSNLGDSGAIFQKVYQLLSEAGFAIQKTASVILTAPVDCPPGTPDFANTALIGSFDGTPEELLTLTQAIEVKLGRPADHGFHTPRTCDIDIITYNDLVISTPRLTLPHTQAQQRRFVLEPLAEIAPELRFPDSGLTVKEALKKLV